MNNFNIILTKTESHLKGGSRKFRKWGGDLLDTCKLYIIENSSSKNCKISQKKRRAGSPQTTPKSTHALFTLKYYPFPPLRAVKNPVWQFTGKVWQFDVSSNVNVEGKSFSVCLSFPGNYYKLDFACATLKIFLLNDRKQVFGCLSSNPEMISMRI